MYLWVNIFFTPLTEVRRTTGNIQLEKASQCPSVLETFVSAPSLVFRQMLLLNGLSNIIGFETRELAYEEDKLRQYRPSKARLEHIVKHKTVENDTSINVQNWEEEVVKYDENASHCPRSMNILSRLKPICDRRFWSY